MYTVHIHMAYEVEYEQAFYEKRPVLRSQETIAFTFLDLFSICSNSSTNLWVLHVFLLR